MRSLRSLPRCIRIANPLRATQQSLLTSELSNAVTIRIMDASARHDFDAAHNHCNLRGRFPSTASSDARSLSELATRRILMRNRGAARGDSVASGGARRSAFAGAHDAASHLDADRADAVARRCTDDCFRPRDAATSREVPTRTRDAIERSAPLVRVVNRTDGLLARVLGGVLDMAPARILSARATI